MSNKVHKYLLKGFKR